MTAYPSPPAALTPRLTLFGLACEAAAVSCERWSLGDGCMDETLFGERSRLP